VVYQALNGFCRSILMHGLWMLHQSNRNHQMNTTGGRIHGARIMVRPRLEPPNVDELLAWQSRRGRVIRLLYRNKGAWWSPRLWRSQRFREASRLPSGGSAADRFTNWRWMEVSLISDIHLLSRTFAGGRPPCFGKHHRWDQLFVRVGSAEKDRDRPEPNDAAVVRRVAGSSAVAIPESTS